MDTGIDFISPEFLNILFFQQKNLVIFPYVDLKHLHTLEIFTVGHNVVDLESTALHNLKEILELESTNSYSQVPTLYFVYNLDKTKAQEIMNLDGIRCVLNVNENISDLANGSKFIFYNKKSNQFLNFPESSSSLEFETSLISNSTSKTILQDKIHIVKSTASKIFEELNQGNSLNKISYILKDFDPKYWQKILDFTSNYYDVIIPKTSEFLKISSEVSLSQKRKDFKDFSEEYEFIVSKNKNLGKEFIMLLHEYRSTKVNPSHLELEELFNPLKLYNYLRNRHWKERIPEAFLQKWMEMNLSQYRLTELEISDFQTICDKLNLPSPSPQDFKESMPTLSGENKPTVNTPSNSLPSVKNFPEFKSWLLRKLNELESLLDISPNLKDKSPVRIVVDITNILYQDVDKNEKLKTENIISIRDNLIVKGYDPYLIADASTRHKVNDENMYDLYKKNRIFRQAPAGRTADKYVLKNAQEWQCKFITNDMFEEYWEEFGKVWVQDNRVTFMFTDGQLFLD